jgi:hypothetical protein
MRRIPKIPPPRSIRNPRVHHPALSGVFPDAYPKIERNLDLMVSNDRLESDRKRVCSVKRMSLSVGRERETYTSRRLEEEKKKKSKSSYVDREDLSKFPIRLATVRVMW